MFNEFVKVNREVQHTHTHTHTSPVSNLPYISAGLVGKKSDLVTALRWFTPHYNP